MLESLYARVGCQVQLHSQIHRQKNEVPTIIDTIATGYFRTGPTKSVTLPSWLRRNLSPCRVGCEANLCFVFMALRVCRFYRIFFVGGHLKYIRTTAHPPPRISGKLNRRWIRDIPPSLPLQTICVNPSGKPIIQHLLRCEAPRPLIGAS
jgi:hypothetical protein